jgi:hypothetical protein
VPGSVDEANAMARIGEKSGPRRHGGEMATFAFGTQILLDVTLRRHQGLGLMRVELIGDEDPGGLWIGLDGLNDVSGKVGKGRVSVRYWGSRPARWPRRGWQSNSACHAAGIRIPGARRDRAGWARRGADAPALGCQSFHRYSSHVRPAQQALVLSYKPRTPCRSAQPVQWGRREGE